jgi:ATP-binding cassette subfamily F protein 3
MLSIVGINKSFGGRELLVDASLQVNRGERIGLVGPNGAGKSTLMNMILGVEEPDKGDVTRDRRCSTGFLPQETAPVADEVVIEIAINLHPDLIPTRRALTRYEGASRAETKSIPTLATPNSAVSNSKPGPRKS